MKYAYQNTGLMAGTGGGDKRSLGSLGGGSTLDRPTLPVPGAPEVMAGMGDCGCGCKGAGTCGMGETTPNSIGAIVGTTGGKIALAVAAYLAYKHFKKRR